jgi:murein DD-endopeptidase MepM/ murein hydrolase activator NlpD
MLWNFPLSMSFVPSRDGSSFRHMPLGTTALPLFPHPGAFGFQRKYHVHEGIDLYCEKNTSVLAVEAGAVVAIEAFTGEIAGFPWWNDTYALLVEGTSGVVVYGEIAKPTFAVGDNIKVGQTIGSVIPVLKNPKGRPDTMLHLELHKHGTKNAKEWPVIAGHAAKRPDSLLDPTPYLLSAIIHAKL